MIKRQFNATLGLCNAVTCTDQTAMTTAIAALQLPSNNCKTTTGCAAKVCADAIKVVPLQRVGILATLNNVWHWVICGIKCRVS